MTFTFYNLYWIFLILSSLQLSIFSHARYIKEGKPNKQQILGNFISSLIALFSGPFILKWALTYYFWVIK